MDKLEQVSSDGEVIGWTAEAHGDKVVTAFHPDGHRIVFSFRPEQGIGPSVRSVQWGTPGDHDEDYLVGLRVALGIAQVKGWKR